MPKSIRNNQNLPKFSQKGIAKKRSIKPSLGNAIQQLDYISSKTNSANSMSPEGIRLFFTNFPLVSISQHNANFIVIFRLNIYFHQYNSPTILLISLRFVDVRHIAFNQSAASMTL